MIPVNLAIGILIVAAVAAFALGVGVVIVLYERNKERTWAMRCRSTRPSRTSVAQAQRRRQKWSDDQRNPLATEWDASAVTRLRR